MWAWSILEIHVDLALIWLTHWRLLHNILYMTSGPIVGPLLGWPDVWISSGQSGLPALCPVRWCVSSFSPFCPPFLPFLPTVAIYHSRRLSDAKKKDLLKTRWSSELHLAATISKYQYHAFCKFCRIDVRSRGKGALERHACTTQLHKDKASSAGHCSLT